MKKEDLFEAIGNIKSETIERNVRYMRENNLNSIKEIKGLKYVRIRKAAACFAAAVVLVIGSSGIACAMVPAFREFINSILFPRYTTEELILIENGHMTGSFDEEDVLLTFLDKFNQKEWGNEITVKSEGGYEYELYAETPETLIAFVDSSKEDLVVAVYIRKLEYEDTNGIWQVEGYQLLSRTDAETMRDSLTIFTGRDQSIKQDEVAADSVIMTANEEVLLYNVNDKERIIAAETEDAQYLISVFEGYSYEQLAFEGIPQYVIKTDTVSYMFDSKGHVVVNAETIQGMFQLKPADLDKVIIILSKYDISLQEK